MNQRPAVFLDKDGTILDDVPYNVDPELIRWSSGARAGIGRLAAAGFRLVVVTNQSGIARGYFDPAALGAVEARLRADLADDGVDLDGFYHCPHHPDGTVTEFAITCACRKPMPGMLHRAAAELGLDLARSWMVGDILHDVEAGHRAGARAILIDNGNETEWVAGPGRVPDARVADLGEAAAIILGAAGSDLP